MGQLEDRMRDVKRRREALGWKALELAYKAGVTEETIRNVENLRVKAPYKLDEIERALTEGEAEREKGTRR